MLFNIVVASLLFY